LGRYKPAPQQTAKPDWHRQTTQLSRQIELVKTITWNNYWCYREGVCPNMVWKRQNQLVKIALLKSKVST